MNSIVRKKKKCHGTRSLFRQIYTALYYSDDFHIFKVKSRVTLSMRIKLVNRVDNTRIERFTIFTKRFYARKKNVKI